MEPLELTLSLIRLVADTLIKLLFSSKPSDQTQGYRDD